MREVVVVMALAALLAFGAIPTAHAQQATAEALSERDIQAQKREFKHHRAKQKKLVVRQRAKAKQRFKRTQQSSQD